jgi:ABC-type multidrug transport system ATPase subunit
MMRDVMMAIFGISHTVDTRVGDDFVRGVSGGERKRVSIAEAALTGAKLQCWDNTTRGLDSGNAINFCKTLRLQADLVGVAGAVAIYQAPQSAYDVSLQQGSIRGELTHGSCSIVLLSFTRDGRSSSARSPKQSNTLKASALSVSLPTNTFCYTQD